VVVVVVVVMEIGYPYRSNGGVVTTPGDAPRNLVMVPT
jgi:hypothetical protein